MPEMGSLSIKKKGHACGVTEPLPCFKGKVAWLCEKLRMTHCASVSKSQSYGGSLFSWEWVLQELASVPHHLCEVERDVLK